MKVKKLNDKAIVPAYMSRGAAGFDFYSIEDKVIMPGDTVMIGTGIAVELDPYTELQIRPRSGLSAKSKLRVSNSPGTIDSDYRGEIKILFDNIGSLPYTIKQGERIAQGVVSEVLQVEILEVEELSDTERGSGGFGSTGG